MCVCVCESMRACVFSVHAQLSQYVCFWPNQNFIMEQFSLNTSSTLNRLGHSRTSISALYVSIIHWTVTWTTWPYSHGYNRSGWLRNWPWTRTDFVARLKDSGQLLNWKLFLSVYHDVRWILELRSMTHLKMKWKEEFLWIYKLLSSVIFFWTTR